MNDEEFTRALAFAIAGGLSGRRALEYVGFLHASKPHDLKRQDGYAHEWRDRFKANPPTGHMDDECQTIYATVQKNVSALIGEL